MIDTFDARNRSSWVATLSYIPAMDKSLIGVYIILYLCYVVRNHYIGGINVFVNTVFFTHFPFESLCPSSLSFAASSLVCESLQCAQLLPTVRHSITPVLFAVASNILCTPATCPILVSLPLISAPLPLLCPQDLHVLHHASKSCATMNRGKTSKR